MERIYFKGEYGFFITDEEHNNLMNTIKELQKKRGKK